MKSLFSTASKPAPAKGAPTSPGGDIVIDTTTQTFVRDVIEASRSALVLVDFWAPWCGPCKQLTPLLEKIVRTQKGKVRLVKMNIDDHPAVANQMGVQSIPAVFAFKAGRPVDGFMGALPEGQIKSFIDRMLGAEAGAEGADLRAAAEAAFAAGNVQGAAEIFAAILAEEKDNVEALAGLTRCYIKVGELKQAEQTLALVPPAKANTASIAGARALLELARKTPQSKEVAALAAKVAGDPADHDSRFKLALARSADGNKAEALEHLLEIMRRSRAWNDDGARKQLVQFFDAWGPKDEMTLQGRRQLSLLLFS